MGAIPFGGLHGKRHLGTLVGIEFVLEPDEFLGLLLFSVCQHVLLQTDQRFAELGGSEFEFLDFRERDFRVMFFMQTLVDNGRTAVDLPADPRVHHRLLGRLVHAQQRAQLVERFLLGVGVEGVGQQRLMV